MTYTGDTKQIKRIIRSKPKDLDIAPLQDSETGKWKAVVRLGEEPLIESEPVFLSDSDATVTLTQIVRDIQESDDED